MKEFGTKPASESELEPVETSPRTIESSDTVIMRALTHSLAPTPSPHVTKAESSHDSSAIKKPDIEPSHDSVDEAQMEETDRPSSPTPFKMTPKAPGEL